MPGARRGVVMFLGAIDQLKPGHWVSESRKQSKTESSDYCILELMRR